MDDTPKPPKTGGLWIRDALDWSVHVMHTTVALLKAKLTASLTGAKRNIPKCCIEVWADDGIGAYDDDPELAYCKCMVCFGLPGARVLWLGRSGQRHIHDRIRGKLVVSEPAEHPAHEHQSRTLAQAIFGLAAGISELFGAKVLELIADDNGSGRLVQYYLRLGFIQATIMDGQVCVMSAPISKIKALAPPMWLEGLVPVGFDGRQWLYTLAPDNDRSRSHQPKRSSNSEVLSRNSKRTGSSSTSACAQVSNSKRAGSASPTSTSAQVSKSRSVCSPTILQPGNWRWIVTWPCNSHMSVRVAHRRLPGSYRVNLLLTGSNERELACGKGAIPPKRGFIRILWLGRSNSQPVHPSVRGHAAFKTAIGTPRAQKASRAVESDGDVTAAIAVLGTFALLGQRLGIDSLDLQPLDMGSGKLIRYLSLHGLKQRAAPATSEGADSDLWMEAPCEALVRRCCPTSWLNELPPTIDIQSISQDSRPIPIPSSRQSSRRSSSRTGMLAR